MVYYKLVCDGQTSTITFSKTFAHHFCCLTFYGCCCLILSLKHCILIGCIFEKKNTVSAKHTFNDGLCVNEFHGALLEAVFIFPESFTILFLVDIERFELD